MIKNKKGITLIALIVTIVVLLILAGVAISVLTGENGILKRATDAKQTNEQKTAEEELKLGVSALSIDYRKNTTNSQTFKEFVVSNIGMTELKKAMGLPADSQDIVVENATNGVVSYKGQKYQVDDFGGVTEYVPKWTQNGTTVTRDGVTLNVGSEVSGYTVTVGQTTIGVGDNKWFVLGAEDGKLLITTNKCYEKVQLSGNDYYANGGITKLNLAVDALNFAATKYNDNNLASSTRTLDYDDIQRIIGASQEQYTNQGVEAYGNNVTYVMKDDGKVYAQWGEIYETSSPYWNESYKFEYWNEQEGKIVTLGIGEKTESMLCTAVRWSSYGKNIPTQVYDLLFANTGTWPGSDGTYWLGTTFVWCFNCGFRAGLLGVFSKDINTEAQVFDSLNGGVCTYSMGLRPVVCLRPDIEVSSLGAITK